MAAAVVAVERKINRLYWHLRAERETGFNSIQQHKQVRPFDCELITESSLRLSP